MGALLDLKFDIDHRLLGLVNGWRAVRALVGLSSDKSAALRRTQEALTGTGSGKRCLLCGNGPSLNEVSLELFADTPSFCANYFYKHPDAAALDPDYYFIIDGKLISGIWPVSMIDEIFAMFPKTRLFLDVRWRDEPVLAPYRDDERIYWILPIAFPNAFLRPRRRLDRAVCGLNVVSAMISVATAMGFTDLGIAGVDGDGLFREILDMQSHFYEGAKDHSMRDYESMVKSLMLSTESLWAWNGIVKTHARKEIRLQNLCLGGIMDCMPRVSPEDFLAAGLGQIHP